MDKMLYKMTGYDFFVYKTCKIHLMLSVVDKKKLGEIGRARTSYKLIKTQN